jgi:hypothetical protein
MVRPNVLDVASDTQIDALLFEHTACLTQYGSQVIDTTRPQGDDVFARIVMDRFAGY